MKPLSIALVIASSLSTLALAGCQTTEEDGTYYESGYRETYVRSPRYVYEDTYVVRNPPPRQYGWAPPPPRYAPPPPPPRYGYNPPPPRQGYNPPPPPPHNAAPPPPPPPQQNAAPPQRRWVPEDPMRRGPNEFVPGSR